MDSFRYTNTGFCALRFMVALAVLLSIAVMTTEDVFAEYCDDECNDEREETTNCCSDCICCFPTVKMVVTPLIDSDADNALVSWAVLLQSPPQNFI
jgi:hypothetical protein